MMEQPPGVTGQEADPSPVTLYPMFPLITFLNDKFQCSFEVVGEAGTGRVHFFLICSNFNSFIHTHPKAPNYRLGFKISKAIFDNAFLPFNWDKKVSFNEKLACGAQSYWRSPGQLMGRSHRACLLCTVCPFSLVQTHFWLAGVQG